MVQVDDSISYDPNMTPNEHDKDWSESVRDAVAAFTRQVGDSSAQLAAAAERFAGDSMKVLDESSRRAEESAAKSNEAAGAAGAAAAEARQMTESVHGMISEAAERVKQETSSFFQDAIRQIEDAGATSRRSNLELQEKVDGAIGQIESSVASARDFASQSGTAAQQAQLAASEARSMSAESTAVAQSAAETARAAAEEIAALREAVARAQRTADEAATGAARTASTELASLREAVAGAQQIANEAAAEAARTASTEIASLREAVAGAERLASQAAAEAARSTQSEVTSLRAAVAGAERTAAEARQVALEATAIVQAHPINTEPSVSAGAQEVLERLEADYSLLTKLVQELHARIASLSTQTSPVYQFIPPTQRPELDANVEETSEPSYEESSAIESAMTGDETVAEMPAADEPTDEEPATAASWGEPSTVAADSWNTARFAATEMPVEPEVAPEAHASHEIEPGNEVAPEEAPEPTTGETIAGRVLVSISPVPDFDRLLSLDGALGRMSGIGNVTLADYAREEVTFRVEVDPPTSVEDFRSRLSVSAGASIEVVASGGDGLALRLAS